MEKQRKKVLLAGVAMLSGIGAFAQGNGSAGINEATQMVTSYFDPATQLIYAIGAVVGLIGGVKVYNKFSSGDPDTLPLHFCRRIARDSYPGHDTIHGWG